MEIIKDLLYILITAAVPTLTAYLCKFLSGKWNEAKTNIKNTKVQNALDMVVSMVFNVVEHTNQVFVDDLKKSGEFNKETAEIAFQKSKETAIALLSEDASNIITEVYGDVDTYIETLIESAVKKLKQ